MIRSLGCLKNNIEENLNFASKKREGECIAHSEMKKNTSKNKWQAQGAIAKLKLFLLCDKIRKDGFKL